MKRLWQFGTGNGATTAVAMLRGDRLNAEQKLNKAMLTLWFAVVSAWCGMVTAFTAPTAGSLGYDVYDVVVNQMLGGPIGFVGGVVLIVWGASQVMRQWLTTVLCIIAGTVIIKGQTIVTSLGALVS